MSVDTIVFTQLLIEDCWAHDTSHMDIMPGKPNNNDQYVADVVSHCLDIVDSIPNTPLSGQGCCARTQCKRLAQCASKLG